MIGIRVIRSFAAGLVNYVFPFFILQERHESILVLTLIYTAATLATAGLGILIGFLADPFRKATFILALAMLPLSTVLIYLSQDLAVIFLAAMIGGYSATGSLAGGGVGGAVQPIQSTVVSDITSRKDRSFYYGLMSFIAGISSGFGALTGGYITTQDVFLVATILGVASTLPAILVRTKENNGQLQFNLKSKKVIGKFGVTGLLNGLSNGLVTPFLIPFFILVYGVTKSQMNVYAAAAGIIGSCSFLLAPRMERALGFLRTVIATRGATIFLMVAFAFVRFLPLSLGIYLIFPAFRVAAFPVIQTAMVDMVDEGERGRLFGISQAAHLATSSAGISFAGYEIDLSELPVPFLAYALVLGANLFIYSRFFSNYKDPLRTSKEGEEG